MHDGTDDDMVYNKDAQLILLSLSCIVITIINTLCVYVIHHSNKLRKKPPTILIRNLIGTHMIQGLFVLPLYIVRTAKISDEHAQPFICDGFYFTYMLTFYSATMSVLLLSLDRVLAVLLLTKYETYVTQKNVARATMAAWSYVFVLCLLPFIPTEKSKALKHSKCHYLQQSEWTIFMLTVNSLLPYIFIVLGYIYVHRKLQELSKYFVDIEKQRTVSLDPKEQKRNDRRKKKFMFHNKVTRLTFIVVLTYGITWSPTMIYYLLQHICLDCFSENYYKSDLKAFLSFLMKYINFFDAIIAPVIYCYFHDEFRSEFKRIICRKRERASSTVNESNGTSFNNNIYNIGYTETTTM